MENPNNGSCIKTVLESAYATHVAQYMDLWDERRWNKLKNPFGWKPDGAVDQDDECRKHIRLRCVGDGDVSYGVDWEFFLCCLLHVN